MTDAQKWTVSTNRHPGLDGEPWGEIACGGRRVLNWGGVGGMRWAAHIVMVHNMGADKFRQWELQRAD